MAAEKPNRDLRAERKRVFIEKAQLIYGDSYDYSDIDFVDSKTPIQLSCKIHGDFSMRPANHLNGQHCRSCKRDANAAALKQKSTDVFIAKARLVHGETFDYSKANETDDRGRSRLICKVHGEFWQFRNNHLEGRGCRLCSSIARTTTVPEFIRRSEATHGEGTYGYSLVKGFSTTRDKVAIICPVHGVFEQIARDHMRNTGCPSCAIDRTRITFEEFAQRARLAHGDRYEYVEESWVRDSIFVTVICPNHGSYEQNWYNHSIGMGCGKCRSHVSKPEIEIFEALKGEIPETVQQSVRTMISPKELDIWIPELKLAIEFNGIAYHDKSLWAKSLKEEGVRSRELMKTNLCMEQGIRLVHIWEDDYKADPGGWTSSLIGLIGYSRVGDTRMLDRMIAELQERAMAHIPPISGHLGFGRVEA